MRARAARIKRDLASVQTLIDEDNQKIGENEGKLKAAKATIAGLADEQFNIAEMLAAGSEDGSSDSQMVTAYLENEIQQLQQQIDAVQATLEPIEDAIEEGFDALIIDVDTKQGLQNDLADLQNAWIKAKGTSPPF